MAVVADVCLEALVAVDVPPAIPHSLPALHGTLQRERNAADEIDNADIELMVLCLRDESTAIPVEED